MEYDQRRRDMLADPDLTGDLLLLALAMDEVIRRTDVRGRRCKTSWVQEIAEMIYGDHERGYTRVVRVIADDLPRYEVAQMWGRPCAAPMQRREGTCGKGGSLGLLDRDPDTGEGTRVWFCARHRPYAVPVEQRIKQWVANGRPLPPANTGGVLRRWYAGNWDAIYQWASGRDPMPGGREATPPRPVFQLIQGGGETDEPDSVPSECGDQFALGVTP